MARVRHIGTRRVRAGLTCKHVLLLIVPEPQTAGGLHCNAAPASQHSGRFLEAGVRLQLLLHRDAE